MTETDLTHFHLLIYAQGVRMYDLRRDRVDAIDQSVRMMADIYAGQDEDIRDELYMNVSQRFAEEPDNELNVVFPLEGDPPIQFVIYHCDYECDNHACMS